MLGPPLFVQQAAFRWQDAKCHEHSANAWAIPMISSDPTAYIDFPIPPLTLHTTSHACSLLRNKDLRRNFCTWSICKSVGQICATCFQNFSSKTASTTTRTMTQRHLHIYQTTQAGVVVLCKSSLPLNVRPGPYAGSDVFDSFARHDGTILCWPYQQKTNVRTISTMPISGSVMWFCFANPQWLQRRAVQQFQHVCVTDNCASHLLVHRY